MRLAYIMCAVVLLTGCVNAQTTANRRTWVTQEKIRAYWGAPYELIEPLRDAGFNVVIQRYETAVSADQIEKETAPNVEGYTFAQADAELLRQSALCKKISMRYFPCLNTGSIKPVVDAGFKDNLRRFHDGRLPCPLDQVYWDRVIVRRFMHILDMLSSPDYTVDGLFIDPEMYYFHGNFFVLPCYCRDCRAEFARSHAQVAGIMDANVGMMPTWLKEHKLQDVYDDWQRTASYELIKQFERTVHARRPDLILGFAIWEDTPWFKVFARGLSADALSVMIVTELPTYSGAFDESYLEYQKALAAQVPVPFINCPGIWVNGRIAGKVPQRLLEVVPGNLYNRTILADGYFLYASDRWGGQRAAAQPCLDAFRQVNSELDKFLASGGSYQSTLKPRRLPVDPPGNLPAMLAGAQAWKNVPANEGSVLKPSPALPNLRESEGQSHVIFLKAQRGEKVLVTMHTIQLNPHYIDKGAMSVFAPDGNCIADVFCDYDKSRSCEIIAPQSGTYAVVATANSNSYTIDVAGAPWVITAKTVKLNRQGGRLFFHVPKARQSVKLTCGGTGEAADYAVYDPCGRKVFDEKQVRELKTAEIDSSAKAGTWCIEIAAIEDDAEFGIDGVNGYALRPEAILAANEK